MRKRIFRKKLVGHLHMPPSPPPPSIPVFHLPPKNGSQSPYVSLGAARWGKDVVLKRENGQDFGPSRERRRREAIIVKRTPESFHTRVEEKTFFSRFVSGRVRTDPTRANEPQESREKKVIFKVPPGEAENRREPNENPRGTRKKRGEGGELQGSFLTAR